MTETKTDFSKARNNAYLKAMGIPVWVERTGSVNNIDTSIKSSSLPQKELITEAPLKELNVKKLGWQELRSVVTTCELCELSNTRIKTVFGEGNKSASLMIIGDAPDLEEEEKGFPFAGKVEKLFSAMLKAMNFQINDVYRVNINKCRPPEDRAPTIGETAACNDYLQRQIDLVQPKIILAMGRIAAQGLLKNNSTLGRLRGQLHTIENIPAPVVVTFHPAYLLRAPNEKRKAWEDLKLVMKQLNIRNDDLKNQDENKE